MINWNIEHMDEFDVFSSLMQMDYELLLMEYANLCKMEQFYRWNKKFPCAFKVSPIHCTICDWIDMYQSVIAERAVIDTLGNEVEVPL